MTIYCLLQVATYTQWPHENTLMVKGRACLYIPHRITYALLEKYHIFTRQARVLRSYVATYDPMKNSKRLHLFLLLSHVWPRVKILNAGSYRLSICL